MTKTHSLNWKAGLAALICTSLLSAPAYAMSIREIRALAKSDRKQGDNFVRYYQVGLMEGVLEAHSQAVRAGASPSICLGERRLEPRMAEGLFDAELKRNGDVYEADMPAQLVMANALTNVYPCSN
jgi:hypothetical protein